MNKLVPSFDIVDPDDGETAGYEIERIVFDEGELSAVLSVEVKDFNVSARVLFGSRSIFGVSGKLIVHKGTPFQVSVRSPSVSIENFDIDRMFSSDRLSVTIFDMTETKNVIGIEIGLSLEPDDPRHHSISEIAVDFTQRSISGLKAQNPDFERRIMSDYRNAEIERIITIQTGLIERYLTMSKVLKRFYDL